MEYLRGVSPYVNLKNYPGVFHTTRLNLVACFYYQDEIHYIEATAIDYGYFSH